MNLRTGVGALAVAMSTMGSHAQTTISRTAYKIKSKSVTETVTHTVSYDPGHHCKKAQKAANVVADSLKADSIKANSIKSMIVKADTAKVDSMKPTVIHDTIYITTPDTAKNVGPQKAAKSRKKRPVVKPDSMPEQAKPDTVNSRVPEAPVVKPAKKKQGCKCCDAHIKAHEKKYHTPAPAVKEPSFCEKIANFFSNLF